MKNNKVDEMGGGVLKERGDPGVSISTNGRQNGSLMFFF